MRKHSEEFHPVVPLDPGDRVLRMNFTSSNTELTDAILENTELFTNYVNETLQGAGARYGIGGYAEHRTIYRRSAVFDADKDEEERRLHLGIDVWGKPYTKVMAPMDGIVHSFAFNNAFGDYGATIILTHHLDGMVFHSLYGHLSLNSLKNLREGDRITRGDVFAEFGIPFENGQWPPHLHLQLIVDMEGLRGDYPGVCRYSEKDRYLQNCPDAEVWLKDLFALEAT